VGQQGEQIEGVEIASDLDATW
jgi:hypothetical protein